jgi:hypothetical protein
MQELLLCKRCPHNVSFDGAYTLRTYGYYLPKSRIITNIINPTWFRLIIALQEVQVTKVAAFRLLSHKKYIRLTSFDNMPSFAVIAPSTKRYFGMTYLNAMPKLLISF